MIGYLCLIYGNSGSDHQYCYRKKNYKYISNSIFLFQIRESFGYQLLDTGYIQITQQSYRPYGLYLYSLSIICFIVILIGQVRIEFDYHGEFRVTPLRVAFLSAVIFDGK